MRVFVCIKCDETIKVQAPRWKNIPFTFTPVIDIFKLIFILQNSNTHGSSETFARIFNWFHTITLHRSMLHFFIWLTFYCNNHVHIQKDKLYYYSFPHIHFVMCKHKTQRNPANTRRCIYLYREYEPVHLVTHWLVKPVQT